MRWDHQAPLLPTPTAGINPSHAAAATAHLDKVKRKSSDPESLGRTLCPPLAYIFAYFFACALGVMKVTTSQDCCQKKKFSENLQCFNPTQVRIVKAMVFSVVMYRCESWTIKKAECSRIDAPALCGVGWRRLLRVPWAARRSNQSILKEISPEYSLEALILKLKLQYFGHLM